MPQGSAHSRKWEAQFPPRSAPLEAFGQRRDRAAVDAQAGGGRRGLPPQGGVSYVAYPPLVLDFASGKVWVMFWFVWSWTLGWMLLRVTA